MPRGTSAAISELFRGFSGYVQADAKSVYDLLLNPAAERPPEVQAAAGTPTRVAQDVVAILRNSATTAGAGHATVR